MQALQNYFPTCFDRMKVIILSKLSLFWIFLSRKKNLDLYSKCEIYFTLFHNSEIYTVNSCPNRGKERGKKRKKEKEDPVSTWLISFKDAHCEKQRLQKWGHVPSVLLLSKIYMCKL